MPLSSFRYNSHRSELYSTTEHFFLLTPGAWPALVVRTPCWLAASALTPELNATVSLTSHRAVRRETRQIQKWARKRNSYWDYFMRWWYIFLSFFFFSFPPAPKFATWILHFAVWVLPIFLLTAKHGPRCLGVLQIEFFYLPRNAKSQNQSDCVRRSERGDRVYISARFHTTTLLKEFQQPAKQFWSHGTNIKSIKSTPGRLKGI